MTISHLSVELADKVGDARVLFRAKMPDCIYLDPGVSVAWVAIDGKELNLTLAGAPGLITRWLDGVFILSQKKRPLESHVELWPLAGVTQKAEAMP